MPVLFTGGAGGGSLGNLRSKGFTQTYFTLAARKQAEKYCVRLSRLLSVCPRSYNP